MRIKHKVNVQIADDADMNNLLFAPDDVLSEVTIDSYARMTSGKFKIDLNTNENLALGDIDAVKGVYIRVDKDCEVKLNGGSEIIQLRRSGTVVGVFAKLFLEADISQINVAAPATEDLYGMYCVWGDDA